MVVGQALSALAFSVAVLALLAPREPMTRVLRTRHFHDLGKLMLALVMLWAYFSFSQFLIIWAGNLPEEIPYYLERLEAAGSTSAWPSSSATSSCPSACCCRPT